MYSRRLRASLLPSALSALLFPLASPAQAPQLINYQGRLVSGTNLVNGSVGLSLRLFNTASGGVALYEDSNTVTVVDGLYSTFIGDDPAGEFFLAALTNPTVYIEAAVNGVALTPRERLVSVGYSLSTRGLFVSAGYASIVLNPSANAIGTNVYSSTVAGGDGNRIQAYADYAFLGGGRENSIQTNAWNAFLGGGYGNSVQPSAHNAFLGGGYGNGIQRDAESSFLGGGEFNRIQTNVHAAFLGSGFGNSIQRNAHYSFLGGGNNNSIQANVDESFLGGGGGNSIQTNANRSFLGGGSYNSIQVDADESFLGGGTENSVRTYSSFLGGGTYNSIETNADHSVLGGGAGNSIRAYSSFLGGGLSNSIEANADHSFLGGGAENSILAHGSFLGGGLSNSIETNADHSFLGGGTENNLQAYDSFLGGGHSNSILASAGHSFLGGGDGNSIQGRAIDSFLGGGDYNSIQASAGHSFLGGGSGNSIQPYATHSFVGGGSGNSVSDQYGAVPGGLQNNAGAFSFAAGSRARATDAGSFVWSDASSVDEFGTTSSNQFLIRAAGGVGIGTVAPATQLHLKQRTDNTAFSSANDGLCIEAVSGESWTLQTQAAGDLVFDSGLGSGYAYISKNQGTFNITSDARFKKNIQPIGNTLDRVLQLQPVTFQYKAAPDESRPVVGFVAQDVEPLFPDLVDVKDGYMAINYAGFGPVAIRAIQEMDAELARQKAENEELKKQNAEILQRLRALEAK